MAQLLAAPGAAPDGAAPSSYRFTPNSVGGDSEWCVEDGGRTACTSRDADRCVFLEPTFRAAGTGVAVLELVVRPRGAFE